MEVVFTHRFSMAHRLLHSGSRKCEMPHGHNEYVTARLAYCGDRPMNSDANTAMAFGELKRNWHDWIDTSVDHAFQLGAADPLIDYFRAYEPEKLARIMVTPGDPSTELLAALFSFKYMSFLSAIDAPFEVKTIELSETPTNSVSIYQDDLPLFTALAGDGWWRRADTSINECGSHSGQAAFSIGKASRSSA